MQILALGAFRFDATWNTSDVVFQSQQVVRNEGVFLSFIRMLPAPPTSPESLPPPVGAPFSVSLPPPVFPN